MVKYGSQHMLGAKVMTLVLAEEADDRILVCVSRVADC